MPHVLEWSWKYRLTCHWRAVFDDINLLYTHVRAIVRNHAKLRKHLSCGARFGTTLDYHYTTASLASILDQEWIRNDLNPLVHVWPSAITLNALAAHAYANFRNDVNPYSNDLVRASVWNDLKLSTSNHRSMCPRRRFIYSAALSLPQRWWNDGSPKTENYATAYSAPYNQLLSSATT